MGRRLLQVVTLLSLLVFLACAVASVRARWEADVFWVGPFLDRAGVVPGARGADVEARVRNRVRVVSVDWVIGSRPFVASFGGAFWESTEDVFRDPNADLRVPGLRLFDTGLGGARGGRLYVAHWLISAVTLPLPVIALLRWAGRARRRGFGRCVACGYDLRASPGRCPECGAEPEK